MVVFEGYNYLELRSHNGRQFNLILTHDEQSTKFKFSIPNFSKEWLITDPIPEELKIYYKKSEYTKLFGFINRIFCNHSQQNPTQSLALNA